MKRFKGEQITRPITCTWEIEAVGGTRLQWEGIRPRRNGDPLAVPGVYLYWGRAASSSEVLSVYAGQSNRLSYRVTGHRKEQDWLQFAIGMYAAGDPLDVSLLRVIEIELVRLLHGSSATEKLHVATTLTKLPMPNEQYLGVERHQAAGLIIASVARAIGSIAPDIDPIDGQRLARVFAGGS
jgi:hypothetical protein